jgi:large subunit ribosomal protein L18
VSILKKVNKRRERRALHVRSRIKRDTTLPRVSVFRSLNQIYAQIIDDAQHATLASCSSLQLSVTGTKTEIANAVGIELAKIALQKGITKAAFDRGSSLYHGRVKALAEGLRAGGLQL